MENIAATICFTTHLPTLDIHRHNRFLFDGNPGAPHMEFQHFQIENLIHYWQILGAICLGFLGSRSTEFHSVLGLFPGRFLLISGPKVR